MDKLAVGVLLVGCGVDELVITPDAAVEVAMMVGEDGGGVELPGGPALMIPPGALDEDVEITIRVSDAAAPPEVFGQLYEFGPSGLVFARPVAVTVPVPDGTTEADLYWGERDGSGLSPVEGEVVDGMVVGAVDHFTEGGSGEESDDGMVSGTRHLSWVSATDLDIVPVDLAALDVQALIDDGAGYDVIEGEGTADGTFEILDVPDGDYWLRLGTEYYRTSAKTVDAGELRQGRPDAVAITTSPTNLVVDATGLSPWKASDRIEMFSTQAGDWWFDVHTLGTAGQPQVDDTALAGLTLDAFSYPSQATGYLIDGAAGDRLVVAQLVGDTTAEGTVYAAMGRVFEAAPFTMTNGAASTVSGVFQDVSIDEQLSVSVDVAAFEAAIAPLGGEPVDRTMYVLGQAGGLDDGVFGATADFIWMPLTSGTQVATDMGYGTPLGGTWGTFAAVAVTDMVHRTATGATSSTPFFYGLDRRLPVEQVAGVIEPAALPVEGWTIGGASLDTPQTGVGVEPVLAWTGDADLYELRIYVLTVDGTETEATEVAHLRTPQTTFTLPPDILEAGGEYVLVVSAITSNDPFEVELARTHLPAAYASRVSEVFSP